jgi:histone-binding protein RBBP4
MPKSPWLIATSGGEGAYYLYDTTESPSDYQPVLLNHHKKEGFGLSWNNAGRLATGATDSTCAIWDIDHGAKNKEGYKPVIIYRNRSRLGDMESYVNDVKWSSHSEPLFGTATEDGKLCIYDARQKNVQQEIVAHNGPVNGMCFSAHCPHLVATASADETVGLWDMRNLKVRLHALMGHSDAVLSIEWSPHHDSVLASSSKDRRIIMWDISKIGEEQQPEDAEDGAPELLFMHGGHHAAIEDFGWNPVREWSIGSVSADAKMQVWRPKDSIVNSKPLQVKDSDLE